jgi:PKD repeat protein
VQFSDLSTGLPTSWLWNFGDGETSTLQNPVHIFGTPGGYSVSLTTANDFGESTRVQTGFITVNKAVLYDIYLANSRSGFLANDGYIEFTVSRPDAWIKIAGEIYQFRENDNVQLIIGDPSSGLIDGTDHDLSAFNFNLVRMYVNSAPVASGIVSDIGITGYRNLRSTITLVIPPQDAATTLFVNGAPVARPAGSSITVQNFRADSSGRMDFQKKLDEVYYKGGAERYQVA